MLSLVPPSPVDPLLILLGALALDAAAGEMKALFRHVPHPVALVGRLVAALDRRLNRETRGPEARRMRGAVTVAVVVAISVAAAWLLLAVTRRFAGGWLVELFVAGVLLAQRSLYDHVFAVCRALETGGVPAGRDAVRHIVGRDPASLDEHGVARAAIESLFENFSDAVVAPAFWYVLLGLPGLVACKAVNTLDSMIGHRDRRYLDFGRAAARLDTALNFVPARLSGLIIVAAALFAPAASPSASWRLMLRDARRHRSVNAGWPEAAAAGALDLALAGPRRYGAELVGDPWMGEGRARATPADIRRALYLFVVACLIHAGLIGVLAVLTG